MRRSHLLGALLARLTWLHLRRRPWLFAAAAALAALALAASRPHAPRTPLQAAPLADGFAVLSGDPGARRVLEVDRDGEPRRDVGLDLGADTRIVGTRRGLGVGWFDGRKIQLAHLGDDGALEPASTWGKTPRQLCAGAASNEHRFAIAWIEDEGTVWFVHGPSAQDLAAQSPPLEIHDPAKASWCAVASAGQDIALLWRARDRLILTLCDRHECSPFPSKVALPPQLEVAGFGCARDTCLVAARDGGVTRLHYLSRTGKLRWTRDIESDADTVAIVGTGDRSFAVAARTGHGVRVDRVGIDGSVTAAWHERSPTTPALAWSNDRLVIAHAQDGLRTTVLTWPR